MKNFYKFIVLNYPKLISVYFNLYYDSYLDNYYISVPKKLEKVELLLM